MIRFERVDYIDEDALGIDQMIALLDNNRNRLRTLCGMVLSLGGLLLSTCFVVVFFLLKERPEAPFIIIGLLLASSIALCCAMVASILAAYMPSPRGVRTKLQLLDGLSGLYAQERTRTKIGFVALVIGILTFWSGLAVFAWSTIHPG